MSPLEACIPDTCDLIHVVKEKNALEFLTVAINHPQKVKLQNHQ